MMHAYVHLQEGSIMEGDAQISLAITTALEKCAQLLISPCSDHAFVQDAASPVASSGRVIRSLLAAHMVFLPLTPCNRRVV